jgi:CheY-specific phosphatase CheX
LEENKFDVLCQFAKISLIEVAKELLNDDYCETNIKPDNSEERNLVIIIGMTGGNRGRIIFRVSADAAERITTEMNMEKLEDMVDVCVYMAEFTNIFAGRMVTYINNKYPKGDIRLVPPAIFSGKEISITTPNLKSCCINFMGNYGFISIDIGFEGV